MLFLLPLILFPFYIYSESPMVLNHKQLVLTYIFYTYMCDMCIVGFDIFFQLLLGNDFLE